MIDHGIVTFGLMGLVLWLAACSAYPAVLIGSIAAAIFAGGYFMALQAIKDFRRERNGSV